MKGGDPLKGVKKKKKKEASNSELAVVAEPTSAGDVPSNNHRALLDGHEVTNEPDEDRRTAAERKHDERVSSLQEGKLKKLAQMSHRDRVKEFNEHLAKLSEHHDIPKVGPG